MAKITRVTAVPFGLTGTTDDFETFGSTAAGGTDYSKDPAAIQATDAWSEGWRPALIASKAPVLQDMNGMSLVFGRQIAYLLQAGIAEWDNGTTYYVGNLAVNPGTGQVFVSIVDANVGNALPTAPASNTNWQFLFTYNSNGNGLVLPGSLTNDAAASGVVGEWVEANTISGGSIGLSGVYTNITSISLTPGDWDVSATAGISPGTAGTITEMQMAISKNSGNTTTDQVVGNNQLAMTKAVPNVSDGAGSIPTYRVSLATTTTYYVKMEVQYTGLSGNFIYGRISARRVR